MTVEEKKERFRCEYMLTKVSDVATCKEDIDAYIKEEATYIGNLGFKINFSIGRNKMLLALYSRLNKVCKMLDIEGFECSSLTRSIDVLENWGKSVVIYEGLYNGMRRALSDDNWHDIYVLAEATGNVFLKTENYYNNCFDSIEFAERGIYFAVASEDDTAIFKEVCLEELDKITASGKGKSKNDEYRCGKREN